MLVGKGTLRLTKSGGFNMEKRRAIYFLATSAPHFLWGGLFILSAFSVFLIRSQNFGFLLGMVMMTGWLSVLSAKFLMPLLSRFSAVRLYVTTQLIEVVLLLFFPFLISSKLSILFVLFFYISGVLDETGKITSPPIFKTLFEGDIHRNVSFSRMAHNGSRIFGILLAGILFIFFGLDSYYIFAISLLISILTMVWLPREILVGERIGFWSQLKTGISEYRKVWVFAFLPAFALFSIIDSLYLLNVSTVMISKMQIGSLSYGVFYSLLYGGGVVGAYLTQNLKLSRKRPLVLTFVIQPFLFIFVWIDSNYLIYVAMGVLVIVLASIGSTLNSIVILQSMRKERVAIVFAIQGFILAVTRVLGYVLGSVMIALVNSQFIFFLMVIFSTGDAFIALTMSHWRFTIPVRSS